MKKNGTVAKVIPEAGVCRATVAPAAPRRVRTSDLITLGQRWTLITAMAAAIAFVLKTLLALRTVGTDDVLLWQGRLPLLRESGGIGLYYRDEGFIHPAFMVHVLNLLDIVTTATGIPFAFWLRLIGILADVGSLVVVWKILEPRLDDSVRRAALTLFAVAPTSIMISGFHGNTDPVMMFFLLFSIYLLDRRHRAWAAGVAFGMSVNIKVWPMVFVPALLFYLPDLRKRAQYFVVAAAVVFVGWLPYIVEDSRIIALRVLTYGSQPRWWGVTRLTRKLPQELSWLKLLYDDYGKFLVLVVVVAISYWMNRTPKKPPLFVQCGLVAFLFMTLTPGFGVQYLAWLLPWVVGLGLGATVLYYATSGVFLFLVYTFWSRGFPWVYGRPVNWGWHHPIVIFELLCWASVAVILWMFVRRVHRSREAEAAG